MISVDWTTSPYFHQAAAANLHAPKPNSTVSRATASFRLLWFFFLETQRIATSSCTSRLVFSSQRYSIRSACLLPAFSFYRDTQTDPSIDFFFLSSLFAPDSNLGRHLLGRSSDHNKHDKMGESRSAALSSHLSATTALVDSRVLATFDHDDIQILTPHLNLQPRTPTMAEQPPPAQHDQGRAVWNRVCPKQPQPCLAISRHSPPHASTMRFAAYIQ